MSKPPALWLTSLLITLAAAYYQRVSGPTYPLSGEIALNGQTVAYDLPRSQGGEENASIALTVPDESVEGTLEWKRFKTNDPWTTVKMARVSGRLVGELPHQPPAGKLEYRIRLSSGDAHAAIPPRGAVVIRFKGDVPAGVLVPHVVLMFAAMLFSTRAGLEALAGRPNLRALTYVTLALMTFGGMVLGPIVQKYAFGEYWTGIPFGTDLTDNKTLIAFVAWIAAVLALRTAPQPRKWVAAASIITFIIFLIPHSLFGSELKYDDTPV